MIISDRLRAVREQKRLSREDIEKRTGLLCCYICEVENGDTVPAIEILEKLARALEVPLYQLFYEGEKPPRLPKLSKRLTADDIAWGGSVTVAKGLRSFSSAGSHRRTRPACASGAGSEDRAREIGPRSRAKLGPKGAEQMADHAYNGLNGSTIRQSISFHRNWASGGGAMDLHCPNCDSTDLKKVSLAYQEGVSRLIARTRIRGVVVGSDGPDLVVGRATTKGTQKTDVSKALTPPKKWSYGKLFGWSLLVFLSVGWLVFYVNTITKNSSSVSSVPLTVYTVLSAGVFVVVFLLYWKHNRSTYPREFGRWDRSFICQRCGTVSEQGSGS
jgi:transcriptional regulator with XRE-family HTH domain